MEAYALFHPGQFRSMFKAMIPEWDVHFAGEHLSTYHGWILGALNSAARAVREILVLEDLEDIEGAWKKFPDEEQSFETWEKYMQHVYRAFRRREFRNME